MCKTHGGKNGIEYKPFNWNILDSHSGVAENASVLERDAVTSYA
jgi:hypothetical protein